MLPMKKLKKTILLIGLLLLALSAATGCGKTAKQQPQAEEADPLVGTWYTAGLLYDGDVYTTSQIEAVGSKLSVDIVVRADNTFKIQFDGEDELGGEWKAVPDADYKYLYVLEGGAVAIVDNDDTDLLFLGLPGSDDSETSVIVLNREGTSSHLNPSSGHSKEPSKKDGSASTYSPSEPKAVAPKSSATMGEKNALAAAKQYLSVIPFSYSGLIEQLEYEGYAHSEAVYGADNCGADWYEQAAKSARQYLSVMSFSRDGLIEQLEYEGFTHEQAVYGVKQSGY